MMFRCWGPIFIADLVPLAFSFPTLRTERGRMGHPLSWLLANSRFLTSFGMTSWLGLESGILVSHPSAQNAEGWGTPIVVAPGQQQIPHFVRNDKLVGWGFGIFVLAPFLDRTCEDGALLCWLVIRISATSRQ